MLRFGVTFTMLIIMFSSKPNSQTYALLQNEINQYLKIQNTTSKLNTWNHQRSYKSRVERRTLPYAALRTAHRCLASALRAARSVAPTKTPHSEVMLRMFG